MWDRFENRLRITGKLVAETALRVGMSAESALPTATDLPVIKDSQGRPFIPGSSLRGAVRAHIERIVRAFEPQTGNGRGASNPTKTTEWAIPPDVRGELASKPDYEKHVYERSCRVERVFGSPWFASRVRFTDLTLCYPVSPELRDSIAIDREKESVANKYDFEVLPAGTQFNLEIIAENLNDAELGLLLLGVRELENGNIRIGGFKGRGLGVVRLRETCYEWVERSNLLDYLISGRVAPVDENWVNARLQQLFQEMGG
ncbi:MAG: CRISPR-associated RAMP protein [Fimbriimonadales bacterium]|nr:MAG: CRISPR-associated RAMP protein [Fimbriimonadales bacterium]